MENKQYYKMILFNITLFVLCFFDQSLQHTLTKRDSVKNSTTPEKLPIFNRIMLKKTTIADDKCHEYSQLVDYSNRGVQTSKGSKTKFKFPSSNTKLNFGNCEMDLLNASHNNDMENEQNVYKPVIEMGSEYDEITINMKHYPHMALLGYGKTLEESRWECGGSLISENWILTAAQCENLVIFGLANWARLGEQPKDYQIVYRIVHPCYRPSSYYNDIALLRLETEVEFSNLVRPICLNTDPNLEPQLQEVVSRAKMSIDEPISENLQPLSIPMNTISNYQCNENHKSSFRQSLQFGILTDRMICAVSAEDVQDTCADEMGNALLTNLDKSIAVYTQFGIQSFGKYCEDDKKVPMVYTKVSKYIPWIESIVWRYY